MNRQNAQEMLYLLQCELNQVVPDADRVSDADAVLSLASRHMVSAAVSMALESAGLGSSHTKEITAKAVRKAILFDQASKELKKRLEEENICYMPLKGAVLKALYPKYGMREFADHDILVDAKRTGDVRRIMEELGFSTEHFGTGVHDTYLKKPVLNFEIHKALFGSMHEENLRLYYDNVWEMLVPASGGEFRFSPEDFYIYMIAHEYKHYSQAGTGIRSLMDTAVFLKAHQLDMEYVAAEMAKLDLLAFEKANRMLALELFGAEGSRKASDRAVTFRSSLAGGKVSEGSTTEACGQFSDLHREMLDYILNSGTYGTINHRVQNRIRKDQSSKLGYMLSRFFVPVSRKNPSYEAYAAAYPAFYKHKILLPALPFYRSFRSMREGRFRAEARAIRKAKSGK